MQTASRFLATLILSSLFILPHSLLAESPWDPCTWGCGDFHRTWRDYHEAPEQHTDTYACNCPPYLSGDGHHGCLQQYGIPGHFNMLYMKICAEKSPYSGYFSPKIRVRGKTCNIACWTTTHDLNGNGECNYFASPLGVPAIRVCARVANPADPQGGPPQNADGTGPPVGVPADHGYTLGVQLNHRGETIDDPVYMGSDGDPVRIVAPKVCAYYDPCLWDTLLNVAVAPISLIGLGGIDQMGGGEADAAVFDFDFTDVNPVSQPLHYSSGVSPLFQLIIAVIKSGQSLADSLSQMANMLADMLPSGISQSLKVLVDILKYSMFIDYAIKTGIAKAGIALLEEIGKLNRVVATQFGCVEVPIGPMPPPYCPSLGAIPQVPVVHPICASSVQGGSLQTQQPTSSTPCVFSVQRNNFLHNAVRVGFDNLMPLCKGKDIAKAKTNTAFDKCVNILGFSVSGNALPSAAQLHSVLSYDTIKLCSPSNPVAPCVQSAYLYSNYHDSWMTSRGVRVVYSSNSGHKSADNYFYDTLPGVIDCSINPNLLCQGIWGVNIGSYYDIPVVFGDETSYITSPKTNQVSLADTNGVNHSFVAMVTRQNTSTVNQSTNQICVYDAGDTSYANPIGCAARAVAPNPKVAACSSSNNCQSTFFAPKMKITLTVGSDSASGVVGPPLYNSQAQSAINLAGNDYNAYATSYDAEGITLLKAPFSGNHSVSPASIFGNYVDNAVPYDGNLPPNINSNALYLGGLEYMNNQYVAGGTQLCLNGYFNQDCITSITGSPCMLKSGSDYTNCLKDYQTNCVLTKLYNSSIISCEKLRKMARTDFPGLTICDPHKFCKLQLDGTYSCDNSKNCNTLKTTLSGIGNNTVSIYQCTDQSYCYTYTSGGTRPLCEVSENPADRVVPSSTYGPSLSVSDYFPYNPQISADPRTKSIPGVYSPDAPNYDTQAVRNKSDLENNLCVSIPPMPDCKAVTSPGVSDGNATWSAAHPGQQSTGTCALGYVPKDPTQNLKRYCAIDKNAQTSFLTPLDDKVGCTPGAPILSNLVISLTTLGKGKIDYKISGPANLTLASFHTLPPYSTPNLAAADGRPNNIARASYALLQSTDKSTYVDPQGSCKFAFYYINDVNPYLRDGIEIASTSHDQALVLRIVCQDPSVTIATKYNVLLSNKIPTEENGSMYWSHLRTWTVQTPTGRLPVPYFVAEMNGTYRGSACYTPGCGNCNNKDSWDNPCATEYWLGAMQKVSNYTNFYTGVADLCRSSPPRTECNNLPKPPIGMDIWIILPRTP